MEWTGMLVGKFELNSRPIWVWLELKISLKTKEGQLPVCSIKEADLLD